MAVYFSFITHSSTDVRELKMDSLSDRATRRAYLITYSQVDRTKFPTKQSFGKCVGDIINNAKDQVMFEHYSCCEEKHQDGGIHYHMAVKLSHPRRWMYIKKELTRLYGIMVHFSATHDNYYTAYKYVCKEDKNVELVGSGGKPHPPLQTIGSPRTNKCIKAFRAANRKRKSNDESPNDNNSNGSSSSSFSSSYSSSSSSSSSSYLSPVPNSFIDSPSSNSPATTPKPKRLSNFNVSQFIVQQDLRTTTELYATAKKRTREGNTDLGEFLMKRTYKKNNEIVENAWLMEEAEDKLEREKKNRMDLLRDAKGGECAADCKWLDSAKNLLRKNGIHPIVFSQALRELLEKGRGKFRNLMIVGPANCGKTFVLSPLQAIFKTFINPANDKYAWVGVEESECVFLNDFRYSSELIAWKDFLNLLEGITVHLPAPKNNYKSDIELKTDIPIFATSKERISYVGRYNTTDPMETEMMMARWKVFEFNYQIPQDEQENISPCGKCFADLVFLSEV